MTIDFAALRRPFPPERISWRVGSTNVDKTKGLALAYIDARDVQDRLDEVCTQAGWQCRYVPMHDKKTVCEVGIKLDDGWIWKADGAGDTDVEAEKGALSDAFKRAAVRWGIGRYLYDLDSPWVKLEAAGRSYKIASDEYPRLQKLLGRSTPTLAPKPQYEDEDGQVEAWCQKEIAKWSPMTKLPELFMWEDDRKEELHRLQRKAPQAHRRLMDAFQKRKAELETKNAKVPA